MNDMLGWALLGITLTLGGCAANADVSTNGDGKDETTGTTESDLRASVLVGRSYSADDGQTLRFTAPGTVFVRPSAGQPEIAGGFTLRGRALLVSYGFTPARIRYRVVGSGARLRRSDGEILSEVTAASREIGGFTFDGPVVLPLDDGSICPLFWSEEEEACFQAGGRSTRAAQCAVVCSVPIAPALNVAGFTFAGYTQGAALPPGAACPAVYTAEEDACDTRQGRIAFDDQCHPLCSLPIAAGDNIAGYTFNGYEETVGLPGGHACPEIASAVLLACTASGGVTQKTAGCGDVCSAPVTPNHVP